MRIISYLLSLRKAGSPSRRRRRPGRDNLSKNSANILDWIQESFRRRCRLRQRSPIGAAAAATLPGKTTESAQMG